MHLIKQSVMFVCLYVVYVCMCVFVCLWVWIPYKFGKNCPFDYDLLTGYVLFVDLSPGACLFSHCVNLVLRCHRCLQKETYDAEETKNTKNTFSRCYKYRQRRNLRQYRREREVCVCERIIETIPRKRSLPCKQVLHPREGGKGVTWLQANRCTRC